MKGLLRILALAAVALLVYSAVSGTWRAMSFDSEFAGLVHRTVTGDPSLPHAVVELAAARGITLGQDAVEIRPMGGSSEVTVRYSVSIGIGSLAYAWQRSVSAMTEGASALGAPHASEGTPSTPPPSSGMLGLPSRVRQSLSGVGGQE